MTNPAPTATTDAPAADVAHCDDCDLSVRIDTDGRVWVENTRPDGWVLLGEIDMISRDEAITEARRLATVWLDARTARVDDERAILDALTDGPSVLSNHPDEAVQAALRDGVIRAWGPSATGRTVYALAVREPVAS